MITIKSIAIIFLLWITILHTVQAKGYNYKEYCENNICQSLQLTYNDTLRNKNRTQKIVTDYLVFKRSEIPIIAPKLFRNFQGLREIDLRESKVEEISNNSFRNIPDLQILFLSRNNLDECPDNAFIHNPNLQFLWMDYNRISTLAVSCFRNLTKLQYLSLAGNNIYELPTGIFDDLFSLYGLYIQRNILEELKGDLFRNSEDLNSVIVSENELTDIDSDIFLHKNLQHLDISNNKIDGLILYFDLIVNLKAENAFQGGRPVEFNGAIESLNLLNNDMIGNVKIENITRLEIFSLSGDAYIDLDFLKNANNLRELTLHLPNVISISSTFFSVMTELKSLNLSNCYIRELHPNIFNYQDNLETLDLSNNQLEELNIQLFLPLTKLTYLNIKNNNFKCDKVSPDIQAYFRQNSIRVVSDLTSKIEWFGSTGFRGIACSDEVDNDTDNNSFENDGVVGELKNENNILNELREEVREMKQHLKVVVQHFESKYALINQEIEEIKRRNDIMSNVNDKFWNQISVTT